MAQATVGSALVGMVATGLPWMRVSHVELVLRKLHALWAFALRCHADRHRHPQSRPNRKPAPSCGRGAAAFAAIEANETPDSGPPVPSQVGTRPGPMPRLCRVGLEPDLTPFQRYNSDLLRVPAPWLAPHRVVCQALPAQDQPRPCSVATMARQRIRRKRHAAGSNPPAPLSVSPLCV